MAEAFCNYVLNFWGHANTTTGLRHFQTKEPALTTRHLKSGFSSPTQNMIKTPSLIFVDACQKHGPWHRWVADADMHPLNMLWPILPADLSPSSHVPFVISDSLATAWTHIHIKYYKVICSM